MAIPNQVEIINTTNSVVVQNNNNQIKVINEANNIELTLNQISPNVIQVTTPGPPGPQGPTGILNTDSLATTGSNIFIGDQTITGSVNATLGFTGSLSGTASYVNGTILAIGPTGSVQFNDNGIVNGHSRLQTSLSDETKSAYILNNINRSSGVLIENLHPSGSAGAQVLMRNNAGFSAQLYAGSSNSVYGKSTFFFANYGGGSTRFTSIDIGNGGNKDFYFGNDLQGSSPWYSINYSPSIRTYTRGIGTTNTTFTSQFHNSTGTSNTLVIRDDGFIGIGTTTPLFTLDISGSGRFTDSLTVTGSLNVTGSLIMAPTSSFIFPLTASTLPSIPTGSAYWSGSFLFVWNGSRYMSSSFV